MKRIKTMIFSSAMALLLTACGGGQSKEAGQPAGKPSEAAQASAPELTINLGVSGSEEHQNTIWARIFEEKVAEASDGRIKVEVFPNSVLGAEREMMEATAMGSLDMTIAEQSLAGLFVKDVNVFAAIPYVLQTREEVYNLMDHFLYDRLAPQFENNGLMFFGFSDQGFRHMTNDVRPVHSVDDMKGLQMRVVENPLSYALMESTGAIPVPVSFSELYTALQQGVADGQENPLTSIASTKIYEVQKYLSLDGHVFAAGCVVMNMDFFNRLSAEDQKMIRRCAEETVTAQREEMIRRDEANLKLIKDYGVEVDENPDIESFRQAAEHIAELDSVKALFDDYSIINDVKEFLADNPSN